MNVFNIMWRNVKWRLQNPISIVVIILQPLLWLVLYSSVAGSSVDSTGISNYTAFILPGVMVLVTFITCCSGGMINFIMKSNGSFYRVLISPVNRNSIVLGQMLESILLSLLEVAVLFTVSIFFSVNVSSGICGILLIIILNFITAFFLSGIAYSISLYMPNEVIYETIMTAIVLPVFFMSSALFPPDRLAGFMRIAVIINPFTHIINSIRGLIFEPVIDYNNLFIVITLFLVLDCLSLNLAVSCLKKESNQ